MDGIFEQLDSLAIDRDNPRLVRLGESCGTKGGKESSFYAWSTGRVHATVNRQGVLIRRRLGKVGDYEGIRMPWATLSALRLAMALWIRRREEWAAFLHTHAGYPLGYGSKMIYKAPGKGQEWQKVWSQSFGSKPEGEAFKGEEEFRPQNTPTVLAKGVTLTDEIWQVGEVQTPPEGLKVGEVYQLPSGIKLVARRPEVDVNDGGREISLENGEEEFVAALCRLRNAKGFK